jgi:hypothetical protein
MKSPEAQNRGISRTKDQQKPKNISKPAPRYFRRLLKEDVAAEKAVQKAKEAGSSKQVHQDTDTAQSTVV